MVIRDITANDRALYLALSQDFYSGEATLHPANLEFIGRTFDECVKGSPYIRAVILEEDGKTAGFAQLSLTWSNESGGLVVWLEELFVSADFRGKSLGTQFMDWLMQEYQDASRIRLEVCACNSGAKRLYERYGFVMLDYEQMISDKGPHRA